MYSHPETVYPNGSQLFQKLTMEDTGHYSIQIKKKVFRVKKELDTPMYTMSNSSLTCGCQVGLILQFSFTHRTDSPGSISIPLCIMSQVGFGHLVQDTHKWRQTS